MNERSLHILLIEDDPDYGRLLQRLYAQHRSLDVTLVHRKRLQSALSYLSASEPANDKLSLVLLDLNLPDSQNHRATFEQVFAATGDRWPIIVLTAHDETALAASLVQDGAQDYINKTVLNADTLVQATRHAVNRHKRMSLLRQQAVAARVSYERLQQMIDASGDGMLLLDHEGHIRFANRAMRVMLGRGPHDDLSGVPFGHPVVAEDAALIDILRPDGRQALAEMRLVAVNWPEVNGYLATFRDVTEREANAEALRRSNARFRSLLDSSPDTLVSVSLPAGAVTMHSEAFLGHPRVEVESGATIQRAVHPDDIPTLMQYWSDVLASPPQAVVSATCRVYSASGSMEWVQARGTVSTRGVDGSPREVLVTLSVVTESQQAAARLRESEARFRLVADSAPVVIWMTATDGTLDFVNRAWTRLTGQTLAQTRDAGGLLAGIHPDEAQDAHALYDMALRARQPFQTEFRTRQADGSYAWVLCHGVPREVDSGAFTGYIGSLVDVTQRKVAEQAALDMAVERRQLDIVEHFIQDATHEFRTPLSIINSNVYLVQRVSDPSRQKRYLMEIQQQVEAIALLIDALVTMLQLDGLHQTPTERLSVQSLLHTVQTRVAPRAQAKQLLFAVSVPDDLPTLRGSQRFLGMALYNLVDNAIRYTEPGGSVTIRAGWHETGQIVISVRDTGIGMDPDVLERAFEAFYRQDEAHSTRGFGLGLTIARRIIELHNGLIEAYSVPGEGSSFTVILPPEDA